MSAAPQPAHIAPSGPECLGCRYPLAELTTNICPECGRTFNPADPQTYGPLQHPIAVRLVKGHGWAINSLTALVAAYFLVETSVPQPFAVLSSLLLVGTTIVWFLRFALAWICVLAGDIKARVVLAHWRRWCVTPLLIVGALVLGRSEIPCSIRLNASLGAMNAAVANALKSPPGTVVRPSTGYVGLMPIGSITNLDGANVLLRVRGAGFVYSVHYGYCPSGPPVGKPIAPGYIPTQALQPPWYIVVEEF